MEGVHKNSSLVPILSHMNEFNVSSFSEIHFNNIPYSYDRREAEHSAPTSAEVKKIWIYIPTSPYAFMS
jgi:hypothetical protein